MKQKLPDNMDIIKKRKWNAFYKNYIGYAFVLPFLVLFFIFTILPLISSLVLSLFNFNGLEFPKFVGLDNYKFLAVDDIIFPLSLTNTFVFAFFIGPIGFFASFIMAVCLNKMKMKNLYALAFYAPSITSGVAMTVIWMYFFSNDRYGLVNEALVKLGLVVKPILWSRDPQYIFPIVVLISVWMSMGTGFLVFLAGLQSLPQEIYEQSRIDGVKNAFQELRHITIPMMKPQLLFGSINAIVGSFGVFDVAMQFAGFPSPNYAAHTIVAHAYDYAFIRFEFGYSAAISVILFAITLSLGRIFIKVFKSD